LRFSGGERPYPELPTIPASLEEITGSIKRLLAKMEKLDIENIGKELEGTLRGTNQLLNSTSTHSMAEELNASLAAFRGTLEKLDRRVDPVAENAEQALIEGRRTLKLLGDALESDSEVQYGFNEMTGSLADMARSIRALVDYLERNPQALIFGK